LAVVSRKQFESGEFGQPAPRTAEPQDVPEIAEPEVIPEAPKPKGKPKADDPWFYLMHPDATDSNRITCAFDIEVDGQKEKVEIERGRVETQISAVRDDLIRRGYRWMNEEF